MDIAVFNEFFVAADYEDVTIFIVVSFVTRMRPPITDEIGKLLLIIILYNVHTVR